MVVFILYKKNCYLLLYVILKSNVRTFLFNTQLLFLNKIKYLFCLSQQTLNVFKYQTNKTNQKRGYLVYT